MSGRIGKSFGWGWGVSIAIVMVFGAVRAQANVFDMPSGETSLSFVTVGDPGNAPDTTGYGAVPYTYAMSTYDTTVAQYCLFLNAVAATDPYGLYVSNMAPGVDFGSCGISRSGSPGSYTYSYAAANANFPVNEVSFGDALRYANWLANGQPTGAEGPSTTEDGSYSVNGAMTDGQLNAVIRSASATYVIPSLNEWYKAAYYKGGSLNAGYWLYPTQSDTVPSNVLSATGTNNANFVNPGVSFTDPVNGVTSVGAFADSPGSYGTYDMGGDVFQWTEGLQGSQRLNLGGGFNYNVSYLASSTQATPLEPSNGGPDFGFRVALVPEPCGSITICLLTTGLLRRSRRHH